MVLCSWVVGEGILNPCRSDQKIVLKLSSGGISLAFKNKFAGPYVPLDTSNIKVRDIPSGRTDVLDKYENQSNGGSDQESNCKPDLKCSP